MFKKLFSVIGSARQTFGSDTALIKQGLSGLDLLDKELAKRAVEFVAHGNHIEVLIELRGQGDRASLLLGHPGRLGWGFFADPAKPDCVAAMNSLRGRHLIYQRAVCDEADIVTLVRLAKVLEAADHGQNLVRTEAPHPDWLQYLLNDALWIVFPDIEGVSNPANRPSWDVNLLAAILAHEELPSAMVLPLLFERKVVGGFFQDETYGLLLRAGALDDYMLAHASEVEAAPALLSVAGRISLLNRIGSSKALLGAFTDLVVRMAVGDSKIVRADAARYLDSMDKLRCTAILGELLRSGQTAERANAADLLARTQGEDALPVLEDALAKEGSKPVQESIRAALSRLLAADDAGERELLEPPPLPALPEHMLGDDAIDLVLANRVELLDRLRKGAEEEAECSRTGQYKFTFQRDHYQRVRLLTEEQLRSALLALNGHGDRRAFALLANEDVRETLGFSGRLMARPDFGLLQVLRWTVNARYGGLDIWSSASFQTWLRRQNKDDIDLRQLAELIVLCGGANDALARACLVPCHGVPAPQSALPAHRVWPYFARHPELIDEGLGLSKAEDRGPFIELSLGKTLEVLATFPMIPARWLPRAMEFALGDGKTHRAAAQGVLSRLPDIGKRVCEALASSKQEIRIEAARWLAKLECRAGVPALYAALEKETRETASAALMTALENLGEDLAPYLAPEKLLAQARKGLKGKPPAGLAWLNLDRLPACHWLDGSSVEPDIIRWWVIIACKLKEPGGNALLERYLGLIEASDRSALAAFLLHQFIAHDTANPSLEEGVAWANAHAPQHYQNYQAWRTQQPQTDGAEEELTEEQVFEQLKREKMAEYLGTAINEKGILALVSGMRGHELVSAIQRYMRDHYQRRAQVEALLEAACASNEPCVIQFVLSIARRYRTASVQEKARMLVQRIAERNDWTPEQLADRTVPSGGLDEQGRLTLQYGSREYVVTLDGAMKPVLQNRDGKVVSALPEGRQDDSPESIKEAKQQFASCKKELKQVLEMQTARLYEAMCGGRTWPAGEWREYLQQHPIVGRLGQRLVWMECSADGLAGRLFRPAEDGSLLDTADEEIELADTASIRLAHRAIVSAEEAAAWVSHFKDYKVVPLFAQMARPLPSLAATSRADIIADRLGWLSDTFTLRGAFNKLGYQRGQGEGTFDEYRKDFESVGIRVRIEFSGSLLPETNMPAVLKTLSFLSLDSRRYDEMNEITTPLDKVPPVLLAEAYGDYHAVAAACAGFDPQWENKVPW
jgi:hypothetical protein